MRQVSVIGSSQATDEEYSVAYRLGRLIARHGWVVVSGGRTGVMEAVSKGAVEEGGLTVGILTTYTGEYALVLGKTVIGFKTHPVEGVENYTDAGDFLRRVEEELISR